MTEHISNKRLYEKCGSILLSRAIMKERLRWLGHILWMKDDRLPKIVLFDFGHIIETIAHGNGIYLA